MVPEVHGFLFLHMYAVLPCHGTVELHVPGTYIPPQQGGCQLVHRPESKPLAIGTGLTCGEVAAMYPQARFISSTLFPGGIVHPRCFQPSSDDLHMICDVPDDTRQGPRRLPGHNLLLGSNDNDFSLVFMSANAGCHTSAGFVFACGSLLWHHCHPSSAFKLVSFRCSSGVHTLMAIRRIRYDFEDRQS